MNKLGKGLLCLTIGAVIGAVVYAMCTDNYAFDNLDDDLEDDDDAFLDGLDEDIYNEKD